MIEEWLTTQQAAEISGYHADHIRRLIRTGRLKARKFGPVWQVNQAKLRSLLKAVARRGAKRGPKPRR